MKYSRAHSFSEFDRHLIAAVCYFISCKSEDMPIELKTLIIMYHELRNKAKNQPPCELTEMKAKSYKEEILKAEMAILQDLNFELQVELPYQYIEEYQHIFERLDIFDGSKKADCISKIITFSSLYCHDSFMCPVSLYFHPLVVACCCVKMSLQYVKINIPDMNGIPWYKWICGKVEINEIEKVRATMNKIYKPSTIASCTHVNNTDHIMQPTPMLPATK